MTLEVFVEDAFVALVLPPIAQLLVPPATKRVKVLGFFKAEKCEEVLVSEVAAVEGVPVLELIRNFVKYELNKY